MKIWVEALTYHYTFPKFLHHFGAVFILSEVVALHELGQPSIWWLEILALSHNQVPFYTYY